MKNRKSHQDVAQVCLNGHLINEKSKALPELNREYCERCGSPTITQCPKCNSNIRGYDPSGFEEIGWPGESYSNPSYCSNCGAAYPWTEAKIQAAREVVAELENIEPEERDILHKSIEDLVNETPKTELAAIRFKKAIAKSGKEAVGALKSILIDIVSETAKRIIWPS